MTFGIGMFFTRCPSSMIIVKISAVTDTLLMGVHAIVLVFSTFFFQYG